MRVSKVCSILAVATVCLSVSAASKNPADYPFRLRVFPMHQTNFYHARHLDESKGEGRGVLFANGDVRGVDFTFECSTHVNASVAFETYPARWKKPNRELTVLLPVFGKAGEYAPCDFKTDVKDTAYVASNGHLLTEPAAEYKAWMAKHHYDPEHGLNEPTDLGPSAAHRREQPGTASPAPPAGL